MSTHRFKVTLVRQAHDEPEPQDEYLVLPRPLPGDKLQYGEELFEVVGNVIWYVHRVKNPDGEGYVAGEFLAGKKYPAWKRYPV